jgi:hypothetical protein
MKLIIALCAFGGLCMTTTANAELTIKDFAGAKASGGDGWRYVQMYLAGAGEALMAANTELTVFRHQTPLYCQPQTLGLNVDNLVDVVSQQIERWKGAMGDETPLLISLVSGMQYTFPCKSA